MGFGFTPEQELNPLYFGALVDRRCRSDQTSSDLFGFCFLFWSATHERSGSPGQKVTLGNWLNFQNNSNFIFKVKYCSHASVFFIIPEIAHADQCKTLIVINHNLFYIHHLKALTSVYINMIIVFAYCVFKYTIAT